MYAAIAWVSAGLNRAGLRPFSASGPVAGIRPVLTWKSTAAEPTPIRLGATAVPWAWRPWQVAQVSAKICWPLAISACEVVGVVAAADSPLPVMVA